MHKLNDCRLLNVNIPAGQDIKGIKVCRQARGRWIEEFKEGIDPRGEKYYWLTESLNMKIMEKIRIFMRWKIISFL